MSLRTDPVYSPRFYWIPAFEILEAHEFTLVNTRYANNVPGRKTDVSHAEWLRRLHFFGLLRSSFRPKAEIVTLAVAFRSPPEG